MSHTGNDYLNEKAFEEEMVEVQRQKTILQEEVGFEVELYQSYIIECACDLHSSHLEKHVLGNDLQIAELWIKEHIEEIKKYGAEHETQ
tara:strand:+ start:1256 stop:1522 length:267 start_codon:yes stop_codon:yes gene_type:complete